MNVITWLINKIDEYENRHLSKIPKEDLSDKIQDSYIFENSHLSIDTDTGWESLSALHITRPYQIWELETNEGLKTKCADNHIFFREGLIEVYASKLKPGDSVITRYGIQTVKKCEPLEQVSVMYDLTVDSSNHRFYGDDFLSHQTVLTTIFITWFILFNFDKNVMILANKAMTATEIVDKTKTVIKNLPFFLKPGIVQNNGMSMKFDNGCRIISQSTTKSAAIGYTIHLAYMDEFAHIHANFIEPFYRSVYPTLSSSNISRVIVTSTPNGRNKFYHIYQGAIEKKNEYYPIRVDWWEVPGHDEEWKQREIANLGSEDDFNQEYGNQFLNTDTLLLPGSTMAFLNRICSKYIWKELEPFEEADLEYRILKWHPKFDMKTIQSGRFLICIDLADGIGKDFSVATIFKIELMSKASINKLRNDRINDESSFYRLVQVGMIRSNKLGVEDFAKMCEILIFKVFHPDRLSVALEMNFKGEYFNELLKKNPDYYEEIFIHTKHGEGNKYNSLGIKLYTHNKMLFCRDLRKFMAEKRIILNEEKTHDEMASFGINKRGSYSSQSGYDDIAITAIYAAAYLNSESFSYKIEEIVDDLEIEDKMFIQQRLEKLVDSEDNEIDSAFLKKLM